MRLIRSLIHAVVLTLILVFGAGVAAVAVSQTSWFRNWLRGFIVSQSAQYLNGQLAIGRVDGNLFYGLELGDVTITMDGQPVISLQDVVLRYNAWQLLTTGLSIDELRISRPEITLRADDGGWQIARLLKEQAQEADREGPARPFSVDRIIVAEGHVTIDAPGQPASVPDEVRDFSAVASFGYEPVRYSLTVESLSLQSVGPNLDLQNMTGGIAVKDDTVFVENLSLKTPESALTLGGDVKRYLSTPDLRLQLNASQISIPEIARFVPALAGVALRPSIEANVAGPLDALKIDLFTRSDAGAIKALLHADLVEPEQAISGDVSVEHLNVARFVTDASPTDITGDAKLEVSGPSLARPEALSGRVSANARVAAGGYVADRLDLQATLSPTQPVRLSTKVFAYGASATADGHVTLPLEGTPLRFDLRGRASTVNLRSLPRSLGAPSATTNLNATYHVTGTQPLGERATARHLSADLRFGPSSIPGVRIEDGGTASIDINGRRLGYKVDASVSDVDLEAVGRAFGVPALADARYASNIDAHIVAEGQGTDPATLDVDATGAIPAAELLGGRLSSVMFSAGLHQNHAQVEADGTFAGFDPAQLTGKPETAGRVSGEFSLEADASNLTSGVSLATASVDGRVTLEASTIGNLAIERASLNAALHEEQATVRELNVVGRDLNVSASGTVAVGEEGNSNLTFRADSSNLEEVGKIVGVPLTGVAKVDGAATGNRQLLNITGTLEGDGLRYQDNGALALRSQFTAAVPDLTFARAKVDAESRGTFVTVAGQNINEVTATTVYDNKRVTFEVSARQPQRQVDAAGALTVHPDHQEVHLDRLSLQTAGQVWQVPQGVAPAIEYGGNTITVENLRLTNADQEISASGRFGSARESLDIQLRNVDLAAVDALLLRQPQFSGRLNASAKVSGTREAPVAAAEFAVNGGGFRQFAYESFKGTVDYAGTGVTLDARLQQSADQWITAKGYVPTTVFSAKESNEAANVDHGAAAPASDRLDLTIDSSPLGLGLVQGFTTQVSDVAGTVEAHVRLTGTGADPHPEGTLTLAGGTLTVVPTGVTYTNIAGKVDLRPDRIHIDQITVLDNHQSALSITGDLAVHARDVQGVQLWVNAEDFKVIDNKMGNVRIQTAMEIAGELKSPMIQGDFSIDTGRVNLDEVIAAVGPSAYSTTQVEYLTRPDSPVATPIDVVATEPEPSIFDALRMNLRVQVPNDLVVKASSLQAPGAPVSLGALNVTLGGDLTALKDTRGPVRLSGSINTVRGTYDFQGRRFDILRDGSVRFDGGDVRQPVLDIRTRREIQGVEALVAVRGRLDRPEVILASTPPLDDADILSLIVFNQPVNQLGAGQQASLTARAQGLALGAVTGQLAQEIGAALNLDTFEINLGPENGAAAELTLGQQLGKDLFLKVQQGVGESSSTNVVVEYAIASWLRLQTNFLQGSSAQQSLFRRQQGSGADLIVLFTK